MSIFGFRLSISQDKFNIHVIDKRGDFSFSVVNFPFCCCDLPLVLSYDVYIPKLIRFARIYIVVSEFNDRNLVIITHKSFMCPSVIARN